MVVSSQTHVFIELTTFASVKSGEPLCLKLAHALQVVNTVKVAQLLPQLQLAVGPRSQGVA